MTDSHPASCPSPVKANVLQENRRFARMEGANGKGGSMIEFVTYKLGFPNAEVEGSFLGELSVSATKIVRNG